MLRMLLSAQPSAPTPPAPEWRTFEATAYTAHCRGCTGVTRTGLDVRRTQVNADGRHIVATDPDVIPLGTAFDIRLADGSVVEAVAEDIGAAIKGERLDVLVATRKEAVRFGRQRVEVRIIADSERNLREKAE